MTDDEARARARYALRNNLTKAEIESDSRVIVLDDPDATGVAVEAWVYLMRDEMPERWWPNQEELD